MDKSRQQFEAWFSVNQNNHLDQLKRDQLGNYFYIVTRAAWEAWQAHESLINNLEPIAWIYPSIGKSDCMVITKSAEESENIEIFFDSHGLPFKVTPLYRLDK
uniref:hypothetical protein n=1 Tax=Providencia rettgeri TaxID=587 RepID=UPI002362687C